jgi:uncharacterized protein (DUF433 family)
MASAPNPTYIGDLRQQHFTLSEAARILNKDVGVIRKAVDRERLDTAYRAVGKRRVRLLTGIDILYLRLSDNLNPKLRGAVYQALTQAPEGDALRGSLAVTDTRRPDQPATVDIPLERVTAETLEGIRALDSAADAVEIRGGTAFILGTGVEAHRIAALAVGGLSHDEILRDYGDLTTQQVEAAVVYARTHPKQGRPYPPRTVKSVLRSGRGGLKRAFAEAGQRA